MTDNHETETLNHINKTLAEGEPPPGIDLETLLMELGAVTLGAGRLIHLKQHDYATAEDVQPHVEGILEALGHLMWDLSSYT